MILIGPALGLEKLRIRLVLIRGFACIGVLILFLLTIALRMVNVTCCVVIIGRTWGDFIGLFSTSMGGSQIVAQIVLPDLELGYSNLDQV